MVESASIGKDEYYTVAYCFNQQLTAQPSQIKSKNIDLSSDSDTQHNMLS